MKSWLKYQQHPNLQEPVLIAAWPGMGKVAFTAAAYLKKQLDAQVLADIEAPEFFTPTGSSWRSSTASRTPSCSLRYLNS